MGFVTMLFALHAFGQTTFNVPEVLYYKFDQSGTTVQNFANPGTPGAGAINGNFTQAGVGQFGSALVGTGTSGTANNINTNWPTALTGDWTISFWLDMNQPTGTSYLFGDATASGFRCFGGGVAPANGLVVRGTGWTDLQITNVLGTTVPNIITVVYTASTGLSEAYVNGVSVNSLTQATNLSFTGNGFGVGTQGNSGSNGVDGAMDEFRLYNRALTAGEISSTYNQSLPLGLVCGVISNTTFTNVTSTGFDVTWDHGSGNDDYEIEYGPAGFTPGTGFSSSGLITGVSNTENITGLTANSVYHVIITENCNSGNDDYVLGPLSVMTLCGTEVAPWISDFENGGALPTCWEQGLSNGEDWKFDNTGGFNHIGTNGTLNGTTASGGYFAWVDDSSPNSIGTSLITPFVDVTGLNVPMLTFYLISDNEGYTNVNFSVDVWDGAAWNIGVFTSNSNTMNNSWEEIEVYLNNLTITGDIQARFVVDEINGTDFYDDIAIDDVSIFEAPTCLKPTGLLATNITGTSADLTWTENNGSSIWNLEWGVAGFTPGSAAGNLQNGVTNPYNITLTPNTDYEFYVQTDCGGGDISAWAGPYLFSNQYCDYTVTNGSPKFITSFITNGAIVDISNPASGPGTTSLGYSDFTTIVMDAYETQTIDFSIETSSTFSYGIVIYVDWNDDFIFDVSEQAYSSAGYTNTPAAGSFAIPLGATVGQHRMRVIADDLTANPLPCSGNSAEAEDYIINVITPPSCLPPLDLDTITVSTTTAELSWTELNSASSWIIEYGLNGYIQGNGTEVVANTNPFTVTGLNPSANYDFYVRSDCGGGDSSAWRGPITFYTDCGIAVAPYYEGFNSAMQPQCWENLSSNTSASTNNFWKFDNGPAYGAQNHGRPNGTYAWSDGSSTTPDSMMLITPEIDISQLVTPYLSFEWFSNNTNNPGDNVPLIIEVFDGTAWNLLDTLQGDSTEWLFVNYDLSAYSSNIIQVRFMTNQVFPSTLAQYNDILLDEVRIDDCISLGGQDGSFDICRRDSNVNLNDNIIVKPNGGGVWSFPSQPTFITQDSIFGVTYLPAGSYDVFYVERYVCYDTTTATINVFKPSSAGFDGADTVCKNEPINLFGALSGNVDSGGDWFDFTNTMLPNSQPNAQAIPGNYNYFYVANNGVCPADSSIVTVKVSDTCDFLALGEELFTDISVYPNPATSQLNIVNPSNTAALKVEMFDMNGRVVLVENKALNNASEATLAIDHLEKGIYTLRVYNNEGQKTFKVVKQ